MPFTKSLPGFVRSQEEYKETIVYGQLIPYLEEEKNLIAYFRKGEKTLLVLANFQKDPRKVQLPAPAKKSGAEQ